MNYFSLIRTARLQALLMIGLASVVAVTGCRKEEIRVYKVPKQQTETVASTVEPGGASRPSLPGLEWKLPEGWTEQPASKMRAASFSVAGQEGQEADVSVIPLAGVTRKEVDVVNLWREQVHLPAIGEEEARREVEPVEIGGASARLFEMVSKEPLIAEKYPARILVAALVRDNTSWFFKMTGADALVREQKPAFLRFLKSISFREGSPSPELAGGNPPVNAGVKEAPQIGIPAKKTAWSAPSNWQELPATQMLLAKFLTTGDADTKAEITISVFPGDVGGLLANVNRWRNQVGLPPVQQAEMEKLISPLDLGAGKATLVDMTGKRPGDGRSARLVGAIVPQGDRTGFYKLLGDEVVVAREKEPFIKFVQSAKLPDAP